jgi:hypothetical protein
MANTRFVPDNRMTSSVGLSVHLGGNLSASQAGRQYVVIRGQRCAQSETAVRAGVGSKRVKWRLAYRDPGVRSRGAGIGAVIVGKA